VARRPAAHRPQRAQAAGTKGKVDGQASLTFLAGLLQLLRQSGYAGLVVVLDEVETIQRMNAQTREKALNALRQLMDMLAKEELPGLYLRRHRHPRLLRGLQGPQGARAALPARAGELRRRPALRQPAAPQVRLMPFTRRAAAHRRDASATSTRRRTRSGSPRASTTRSSALVAQVTAGFGGKVALAPRLFLRELIDVLDRVDLHEATTPRRTTSSSSTTRKLTPEELAAKHGRAVEVRRESEDEPKRPRGDEPEPPAPKPRLDG
jgi:hypothetical protein